MAPDDGRRGGTRRNRPKLRSRITTDGTLKRLMDRYNRKGIFSNRHDGVDGLKRALDQRFRSVSVEIVGCVALFSGRV